MIIDAGATSGKALGQTFWLLQQLPWLEGLKAKGHQTKAQANRNAKARSKSQSHELDNLLSAQLLNLLAGRILL